MTNLETIYEKADFELLGTFEKAGRVTPTKSGFKAAGLSAKHAMSRVHTAEELGLVRPKDGAYELTDLGRNIAQDAPVPLS